MDYFITIFTPTYNRAYMIGNLYSSLLSQTYKDFEWLIVDDGSTDETEELIAKFINDDKIIIRYYKQENGGKHRAINKGLEKAKGELFFIVDSDDTLPRESLSSIITRYIKIKHDDSIAGVVGLKCYPNGQTVGTNVKQEEITCTSLEFRYKYKVKGDRAEIYLTRILKQYSFPEIVNERFCPEALVWNRIAQKYRLFYFRENIYECEYLKDGLTAKIVKIRMESPISSMITYSELMRCTIPLKEKIKASINYWRFSFNSNIPFHEKIRKVNILMTIVTLPLGFVMYVNDCKNN